MNLNVKRMYWTKDDCDSAELTSRGGVGESIITHHLSGMGGRRSPHSQAANSLTQSF